MGQCMQVTVTSTRLHPYLGYLEQVVMDGQKYLRINFPIASEEEYIGWSKKINKLRYNLEVKDCLFLPKKEEFRKGQSLCEASSRLVMSFDSYFQTLRETLQKNKKNRKAFPESYLWYLIYVLTKYVKYYDKKQEDIGPLCLENILLSLDGTAKIVPKTLIPDTQLDTMVLYMEEEGDVQFTNSGEKSNRSYPPIYIVGLICLILADLLEPSSYYQISGQKWKQISTQARRDALKNCQKRYSPLLVLTLSQMVQLSDQKRINVNLLYKRLQLFESEITAKRQLGFCLGHSSVESVKTSYCLDNNRTLNNNSNLLRISEVSQHQPQNERVYASNPIHQQYLNTSEDYMHIL